jgi:hypothetical protein
MRCRSFLALVAGLVLALAAACDDEGSDGEVMVEPTPRVPGVYSPQGEQRIEEIVITDNGIDPDQVSITASAPAEVQVANRSDSPCTFFIGDYLIGLEVPPGDTVKMGMTVPEGRSGETVTMGCQGDPDRQGSAVIEFKGVLPGVGR